MSVMKDLTSEGECSHVEEKGSIQYTHCPGEPIFEWNIKEEQKGDIVIRVDGSELKKGESVELKVDDTKTLSWDLFDAKGNPIPTIGFNAYIEDEDVVSTFTWGNYSGNVKAIHCGETRLIVEAGCENKGEATIKVASEEAASVKIDPPSKTELEVCETLELAAKVFDECDNEIETHPITWSWSSADTGEVDLDPNTGIIEGKTKGTVEITATASEVEDKITLSIKQSPVDIEIQPTIATIKVGEELPLGLHLEDNCGDSLNVWDYIIEWTIPEGIIAFDLENQTVTGVSPGGPVEITATCQGISATVTIIVEGSIVGGWVVFSAKLDPELAFNIFEDGTFCEGEFEDVDEVFEGCECWGDWTLVGKNVNLEIECEWGLCVYSVYTGTVNDEYNYMSGTFICDTPGYWDVDPLTGIEIWIPAQTITGNWNATKISDTPF